MKALKKKSISLVLALTILMSVFIPLTAFAEEPTTYAINCVAHNLSGSETAGTVYIQSDIDSYSGSAAFGYATENAEVTINASANPGYEFVEWRKSAPESENAGISASANYVFSATENVWLYAIFRKETWSVNVSSIYVCDADYSYSTQQKVEKGQAMTPVIITANEGYYFPENLAVQGAEYGVAVTRDSYTQVTVSGTPTANVNVAFSPKAKKKEETPNQLYFEATGVDTGNICNLQIGATYSISGAATAEFTATESTYALTDVTKGQLTVVKKASNTNTMFDSDAYSYTVGKHATVPNCYSTNCTDINNNNGKIQYVSVEMEYQKEGDDSWTIGNGGIITGLTPGTYYVRYKASSINLAGDSQVVIVAEYNVPELTGTVEITGIAKFGEELTAEVNNSNNTGTLFYQWMRNNSAISGATLPTYTISAEDVGTNIKVKVTSSVESGLITSNATEIVEKAEGPAAPTGLSGVAPTVYGGADGKIVGTATTMEYSTDISFTNANVCPDGETVGLTAGTYYVRYRETLTHKKGAYVEIVIPKEIKIVKATINGVVAGATAGSATVATDDTTYTVSIKGWYECDNVFAYASAPVLQSGDKFESEKTYTVGVDFTPIGDSTLSANLKAFINDEDGKIGGWNAGGRTFFITITVPKKQPEHYTVYYKANGGFGIMSVDMAEEDRPFTLADCEFTAPEGYNFKAWAIGSENGEQKQPGEQITITKETNIYAIWEEIPHTHKYDKQVIKDIYKVSSATCTKKAKYYKSCDCGEKGTATFEAGTLLAHKYTNKIVKATTKKNGTETTACSACGYVKSTSKIYYPKKIKLSTTSYTYNGKTKKPSVKVNDSKGKTISSKYYTVSRPSSSKKVGAYTIKVTFKTKYTGTVKLTYKINPGKTSVSKLSAAKKSLKVTIKKKSTQVTGYQIQYSTSKTFKSKYTKTKTVKSYKITSTTLKSLKAKKTYYVRVRTYKTVNGKKYYSAWSSYKTKKTK